jgi:quercetin dioxygenase-like cupin family protein
MEKTDTDTIAVGGLGITFLVERPELSVFEVDVPAGAKVPAPHSHDAFDETIYGLEGVATFTNGGQTVEIGTGDWTFIPRGVVHGFVNLGSAHAKFLAIASPGVFGSAYFREIGAVLEAAAGGPPDVAAMKDVMRRHGLTPAPPAAA